MAAGEIDILVATQAAAKGHNFPNLTLVGVVDADLGLRGGDLRAAERTLPAAGPGHGRAGRKERPGRALLQTYAPEHAVMQALQAQDRGRLRDRRDGRAGAGRPAAIRPAGGGDRFGAGRGPAGRLPAQDGRGPRPTRRAWRSMARPTRRWG